MKKRTIATILTCAMTAALLAGCSGSDKTQTTAASESETAAEPSEEATEAAAEAQSEEAGSKADTGAEHADAMTLHVGSLKGPTTIGLVSLMDQASKGNSEGSYEFTMAADASELAAQMVSGDLDIALVPANLASVLYQKTKQGIEVIDINTLGVLYVVA